MADKKPAQVNTRQAGGGDKPKPPRGPGGFLGGASNKDNEKKGRHLTSYLKRSVCISVSDGRLLVGRFMAFDPHMNIVLADASEYPSGSDSTKAMAGRLPDAKKEVGLLVVRGEHVLSIMALKKKTGAVPAPANVPGGASAVPGGQLARAVELPKAGGSRRQRGDDE